MIDRRGELLFFVSRFGATNPTVLNAWHRTAPFVLYGAERSAFFVGISRAKRRLVLTLADHRERPNGYRRWWDENRTPHQEFLGYAAEMM